MAWIEVLHTVAPVFVLAAAGYFLGERLRIDLPTVTQLVVYLAGPALVFGGLVSGPLAAGPTVSLAVGSAAVVVGVGLMMKAVAMCTGAQPGALYLPSMFMNSGNMLLPLSHFAFGDAGLRHSIVIFVTVSVLQSSLGVTIARGRPSFLEMFRLPYIYAAGAAVFVRAADIQVWPPARHVVELVGGMAIPLMLFALGLRLRSVHVERWAVPMAVTVARIGGGYLVARIFVAAVHLGEPSRSCLLLASVMPAAVVNFVFAEKYGRESGEVARAIVVSTLVSLITTPFVLAYGI